MTPSHAAPPLRPLSPPRSGANDEPGGLPEPPRSVGVTAGGPADDLPASVVPDVDEPRRFFAAEAPRVSVVMGSQSDWETMRHAAETLSELGVPHECRIVSAHRTPRRLYDFASGAAGRGVGVIVAGAGGAAHLPGMIAALTHLPVFGVPVQSNALSGWDSLLSIVQMPAGVPVGTLAIGRAGAVNAALLAAAVLALGDEALAARLIAWRELRTAAVAERPDGA